MNYEEYKKLKKQIAGEYERELAALEMVWKRFQSLNSPSRKSIPSANGDAAHAPPIADNHIGELTDMVVIGSGVQKKRGRK